MDYNYLVKGAKNIFLKTAEKSVFAFKQAIDFGIIDTNTDNLYIWEKKKDINTENTIKWYLIDGVFFDFYQNKGKKNHFY